MCGIAGILHLPNARTQVDVGVLERMSSTLVHRGPDGEGLWWADSGKIGLAHRRLSIIDLADAAAQPMASDDGRYRLVFNGEIYNHAVLRTELERDFDFRWQTTHSDTEVVLNGVRAWGIDAVQRFRGMFAFALWDEREQALWLVRDRIGVKPLYYSVHHGRLSFASEIKALLADPEQPRSLNETAFYHYLSFYTAPSPETLFDGIAKLPAGNWLRIAADGSQRLNRYWDVLDHAGTRSGSDGELAEEVLEQLREAVTLRKVADVPIGVFLSGGIDSSTNAALFSEGEADPVRTFSIGYEGNHSSYQNELGFARVAAKAVGAEHHERLLTLDDLMDFLPKMVWHQDEPIADPVCVPVYYVSELARQHGVKVCQVGEGADELFCGYPAWRALHRLQRLDNFPMPRAFKGVGVDFLRATGRDRSRHFEWLRRGASGEPVFWGGAECFTESDKQRLLSPRMRQQFQDFTSWEALRPIHDDFTARAPDASILNWMSYLDLRFRLPELLLMRVDKMSMATGLEARVPFLDHRFVELAFQIPEAAKLRGGELKHMLKRAVRGVIPDAIIDRPKQGFGVPIQDYLIDRLGPHIRDEMRSLCDETDLFDPAGIDQLFERGNSTGLWILMNFAMWRRRFLV